MKPSQFFFVRLLALPLVWSLLYFLTITHWIRFDAMLVFDTITLVLILVLPRPRTREEQRQYTVQQVSKKFRIINQKIVDYQYRPTRIFGANELKEALGIKHLPKPEYVGGFESKNIYTFIVHENFLMKVTIVSTMTEIGGGSTYKEYGSGGDEFGSCKLYEGEIECAEFSYRSRYIHWLTEEFEDANESAGIGGYEQLKNYELEKIRL